MKQVLVTGASGFIGRHCLLPLLAKGYEVHAVFATRAIEKEYTNPAINWHQVNLLDSKQVQALVERIEPTHLLHLAWYTIPGKYWTSPENLKWVQASLNLLQAFVEYGGQRAVVAGTCAEYDWNYGYCSEAVTPLAPSTLYGVCKHALRLMAQAFATQTGLSVAWGRIFFMYGPHEYPSRLVSSVIRSLLVDEPAHCSHGSQIRDFLHVQDVAGAFVTILDNDIVGPVNIGSGQPISIKNVIYKIAMMLERPDLIHLGAIPSSLSDPPVLVANVNRLHDKVGWYPAYDLDTGLDQTIQWWKIHFSIKNQEER